MHIIRLEVARLIRCVVLVQINQVLHVKIRCRSATPCKMAYTVAPKTGHITKRAKQLSITRVITSTAETSIVCVVTV